MHLKQCMRCVMSYISLSENGDKTWIPQMGDTYMINIVQSLVSAHIVQANRCSNAFSLFSSEIKHISMLCRSPNGFESSPNVGPYTSKNTPSFLKCFRLKVRIAYRTYYTYGHGSFNNWDPWPNPNILKTTPCQPAQVDNLTRENDGPFPLMDHSFRSFPCFPMIFGTWCHRVPGRKPWSWEAETVMAFWWSVRPGKQMFF